MTERFPEIASLDWSRFRAAIFDVDGTLYDQPQLRRRMLCELLGHYASHPIRLKEMKILSTFRKLREVNCERAEECLERAQYRWTAEKLGVSEEEVERVVGEWMLVRPLKHLRACRPDGIVELFDRLRARGTRIGILSDYPAEPKLAALELAADAIASSVEPKVNRLKPDPCGVHCVLKRLGVSAGDSLVIGDRDERDGECARRAGCAALILPAHMMRRLGQVQSYDRLFPE